MASNGTGSSGGSALTFVGVDRHPSRCAIVPPSDRSFDHRAWQHDALCRDHPDADWFAVSHQNLALVRSICARCRCRLDCFVFAVDHPDVPGVWAGLTPTERRRLAVLSNPSRGAVR